jgi:hypothetical protein
MPTRFISRKGDAHLSDPAGYSLHLDPTTYTISVGLWETPHSLTRCLREFACLGLAYAQDPAVNHFLTFSVIPGVFG